MKKIQGNIIDLFNKKVFGGTIIFNDTIIKISEEGKEKSSYNYILPGLIDSHVHIESSMLVPSEFARIAVKHGTVACVSDPHEIANILGVKGVDFMLNNSSMVPFKFYFGAPSCVPATPFETAGAIIKAEDIVQIFKNEKIKYLGEVMNFPAVINNDAEVLGKINAAKATGRVIDGHAPGLRGEALKKYISAGISTDHECFMLDEAIEKISLGMKILIRKGSAANNFNDLLSLISTNSDMVMLCSDDLHPDDLILGHINELVKSGIRYGINIFHLLTAACINPVQHYKLDVGLLREKDFADFIVIDNLNDFNVKQTYINGELVAENGNSLIKRVETEKINFFNTQLKQIEDFAIKSENNSVVKVIEAIDQQIITKSIEQELKSINGFLLSDIEKDILKITVVNRYNNLKPAVAFIKNFGLKRGAIASSIAHDSHNIVAVGVTDYELCEAVNSLIEVKGGISVIYNGNKRILPLPIAGIMTDEDGNKVAQEYIELNKIVKQMGCNLHAPFMTLSFMALLVIPELKLSDKGLFDGNKFEFVSLFV